MKKESCYEMKNVLRNTSAIIEEVMAIEILEYHDKNNLSGSNESRSRKKIGLLAGLLNSFPDEE